ncbi:MAG: DUF480 domain-containing protein [Oceanipulchritudo sp.]
MELSSIEERVLGALMEKACTTPDIYPLTLRALVSACNQKTSRHPLTDYDEDDVLSALDSLREKHLAMRVDMAGSRTAKFRENASRLWELEREEYALLTTLLLRGPQTPGQLRQRSERMFLFAELPQVNDWLKRMQDRDEEPHTLVQSLGREPGTKEIRYAHTLAPLPEPGIPADAASSGEEANPVPDPPLTRDRITALEADVRDLQEKVSNLESMLNELTS